MDDMDAIVETLDDIKARITALEHQVNALTEIMVTLRSLLEQPPPLHMQRPVARSGVPPPGHLQRPGN